MIKPDSQEELDFNAWLASINFIDKKGKVIKPVLSGDESPDPEGDRAK